jgi:4-hydroxybenzoate polyprenyltransferase
MKLALNPLQYIRAMRPHQWIKNLLLFAGILFSRHFTEWNLLLRAFAGFGLFCLLAGAVYILNDLRDIENDRLHPRKKLRPIAAGLIVPRRALMFALLAAAYGLVLSFLLSPAFGWTALLYFVITILYSEFFKRVVVLDTILVAAGFVLRAVAGVFVIRIWDGPYIPMTPWFVICVFFLALFIAVCKRRHELLNVQNAPNHRQVLDQYTPAFLDQMIAVSTSAAIFSYTLYLISAYGGDSDERSLRMTLTLPFVIYGIFRYLYLVYRCDEGGEPETLVLKDKPLLLNTLLWLVLLMVLHEDKVPPIY